MNKRDWGSVAATPNSKKSPDSVDVFGTPTAKMPSTRGRGRGRGARALTFSESNTEPVATGARAKTKKGKKAEKEDWSDIVDAEEESQGAPAPTGDSTIDAINALAYSMNSKFDRNFEKLTNRVTEIDERTKKVPQMQKELDNLKKQQKLLDEKAESIKRLVIDHDYRSRELNIMVKGIPLHADAVNYRETRQQTEQMVTSVIGKLVELGPRELRKATRFTPRESQVIEIRKRNKNGPICPLVKLTVASQESKEKLYKGIADAIVKNPENLALRQIQFQTDYPQPIVKETKRLESLAWGIRVESGKTIKTRVECKEGRVYLMVRIPGDTHYKKFDEKIPAAEQLGPGAVKSRGAEGGESSKGASASAKPAADASTPATEMLTS